MNQIRMNAIPETFPSRYRVPIARFLVLFGLTIILFWPEIISIFHISVFQSDYIHILFIPFIILAFAFLHRNALLSSIRLAGNGSGLILVLAGTLLYALASWPFSFGLLRQLAMLPVLAGIVLLSFGYKFLIRTSPVFLLLILAVPLGSRLYARLIIFPETYTIRITAETLNLLPGIDTEIQGNDLILIRGSHKQVVGLGESNRAARLFYLYGVLGIFVIYSQNISFSRKTIALCFLGPLILLGNLVRFEIWSIILAFGNYEPTNLFPKTASAFCAIGFCYFTVILLCSIKLRLFIEDSIQTEK